MSENLIDVDDDFWNHPSLLKYTTTSSSKNTNNQTQSPNNSNSNSTTINQHTPRKRPFNNMNLNNNSYHLNTNSSPNKRRRITTGSTYSNNNTNHQSPPVSSNINSQSNSNQYTKSPKITLSYTTNELAPECCHKIPMIKHTTRSRTANFGRKFWRCSKPKSIQCKSFLWDDEFQKYKKRDHHNAPPLNKIHGTFKLWTELISIEPTALVEVSMDPSKPCFVNEIKKFPNAQFNNNTQKWVIPLDQHTQLIQNMRHSCLFSGYNFRMNVIPSEMVNNIKKTEKENKQPDCVDSLPEKLKSSLYEFQKEGVRFAIGKGGRCLLADEMGLGKTIQAIAVAYYYKSHWPLLIVTPSSLTLTWKCEILKWLDTIIEENAINIIRKGTDAILEYDEANNRNKALCCITIISYTLAVKKQNEIFDNLFGMVICDESHSLKNFKTKRCKVLLPLIKKVKCAILLSGTPTNNRPSELWTQIDALRPGKFMNFKPFTIRYCAGRNGRYGWKADGANHLKELNAIIKYFVMIRRTKKQVLSQLPNKIRCIVSIECDKKLQKKIQKKLSQMDDGELDEWLNNSGKNSNKHKSMMDLFHLTGQSKINKIKEYICDLYETNEKFLIFAHHLNVLDAIEECVVNTIKCGFIRIDGSTKSDKRQLLVNKFQQNDDIRIGILSITAAGVGLTLTEATSVVFAELYWGPTALLQCEDRAHRIGQKSTVNIIYLIGKKSFDEDLWRIVKKKMVVISKTLTGQTIKMDVKERKNYNNFNCV